jgi:hypothetical protein
MMILLDRVCFPAWSPITTVCLGFALILEAVKPLLGYLSVDSLKTLGQIHVSIFEFA